MLSKLIVSVGITDTRKERLREGKIRQRLERVQKHREVTAFGK